MSLQLVILASSVADIELALGVSVFHSEVFPMGPGKFGLVVPTKVLEVAGEEAILRALHSLKYFDLWAGRWNTPGPA
jgi:hypothetical protein